MSHSDFKGKHVLVLEGYCKQCLPFLRSFKKAGCEVTVLCGSRLDCSWLSRLPDHRILGVCDVHRPEESEKYIIDLIKTGKFDMVFSPFDFSSKILAHHKEELSEFAHIVANNADKYDAASDKEVVMKTCMDYGIPCPKTYFDINSLKDLDDKEIVFPIIIKPKSMYGARGFHIFETRKSLDEYITKNKIQLADYVIQEFIPLGSDVGACTLYVDDEGIIKSDFLYICNHLYPENGGTSTLNSIVDRPDIVESCRKLVRKMDLRGIVGVDIMIDKRNNIGKIIEINVRPPHAVSIGFLGGIDMGLQALEDVFGKEVTPMHITKSDFCLRILQTDVLWFLSSPDRFKRSPRKLGFKKVKEQMFYWDDPLPWFGFLISGIKDYRKKMMEKRN